MNTIKFYAISLAQNFALLIAFIVAGFAAAKHGICQDIMDYRTYKIQEAKKVFRKN